MLEPTQHLAVAADSWSPAHTAAPQFNILAREALQANEGNTCGYVSGLSGTYFQPHRQSSTNFSSITHILPNFANMRNEHVLRRSRVLSFFWPFYLHHPNNMYTVQCHERILHRRHMLQQRRNSEMHRQHSTGMLQIPLRLRLHHHDAKWLHILRLHKHNTAHLRPNIHARHRGYGDGSPGEHTDLIFNLDSDRERRGTPEAITRPYRGRHDWWLHHCLARRPRRFLHSSAPTEAEAATQCCATTAYFPDSA